MLDTLIFGFASQTNSGVPTRQTDQTLLLLRRCDRCPPIHRQLSELELGSGGELLRQKDTEWSQSTPIISVWALGTGSLTKFIPQPDVEGANKDITLENVSDKLAFIKAVFSLNMSELASVLKTTRPSVYTWLRDVTRLRDSNLERLNLVYEIAKAVSERTNNVGDLIRQDLHGSPSIVALLSADVVNQEAVLRAVEAVVRYQTDTADSREAARKAFILKHDLKLPSREESQEKVDILTGKRGSDQL